MNTSDRELLEFAAKAVGLNIKGYRVDIDDSFTHLVIGKKNTRERVNWNPLTDDGDALRLAVKLRIGIEINERSIVASWVGGGYEPNDVYEYPDSIQNDDFDVVYVNHDKATRRAIVRAAAEIGKAMK